MSMGDSQSSKGLAFEHNSIQQASDDNNEKQADNTSSKSKKNDYITASNTTANARKGTLNSLTTDHLHRRFVSKFRSLIYQATQSITSNNNSSSTSSLTSTVVNNAGSDNLAHRRQRHRSTPSTLTSVAKSDLPLRNQSNDALNPKTFSKDSSSSAFVSSENGNGTKDDGKSQDDVVVRPHLKVRVITWNMASDIPTGDLSELLGDLPSADEIPGTSLDSGHPYHIIVVGGQEVPFRSTTFFSDIARWGRMSWTDVLQHYLCSQSAFTEEPSPLSAEQSSTSQSSHKQSSTSSSHADAPFLHRGGSSGTSSNHVDAHRDRSASQSILSTYATSTSTRRSRRASSISSTSSSSSDQSTSTIEIEHGKTKKRGKGPYVLVAKERLLNIYLAVFVHSSQVHALKNVCKTSVPAGMYGGRLGNKGGVGISLRLHNSKMLFVCSHLAAHEGDSAMEQRKANVSKIKEGLNALERKRSVDDKDLTRNFDATFWFGDLNFRLNVSRLHADWLLQTKDDYTNALQFDQLRCMLKDGDETFKGFQEAEITFPPTYKYDILRIPRGPLRSRGTKRQRKPSENSTPQEEISPSLAPKTNSSSNDVSSFTERKRSVTPDTAHIIPKTPSPYGKMFSSSPEKYDEKSISNLRAGSPLPPETRSASGVEPLPPKLSVNTILNDNDCVFDSSSKQRVQSWTDRILWKASYKKPRTLKDSVVDGFKTVTRAIPSPHLPQQNHASETTSERKISLAVRRCQTSRDEEHESSSTPQSVSKQSRRNSLPQHILKSFIKESDDDDKSVDGKPGEALDKRRETYQRGSRTPRKSIIGNFFHQNSITESVKLRRSSLPAADLSALDASSSTDSSAIATSPISMTCEADESTMPPVPPSPIASTRNSAKRLSFDATTISRKSMPPKLANLFAHKDDNATPQATASSSIRSTETPQHHSRNSSKSFAPQFGKDAAKEEDTRPSSSHSRASGIPSFIRHWIMAKLGPDAVVGSGLGSTSETLTPAPKERHYVGPMKGDIECLQYDSVADLRRMGAMTDHRPVVGVFAVGQ